MHGLFPSPFLRRTNQHLTWTRRPHFPYHMKPGRHENFQIGICELPLAAWNKFGTVRKQKIIGKKKEEISGNNNHHCIHKADARWKESVGDPTGRAWKSGMQNLLSCVAICHGWQGLVDDRPPFENENVVVLKSSPGLILNHFLGRPFQARTNLRPIWNIPKVGKSRKNHWIYVVPAYLKK